jgi:hypothetical protein
VTVTHYHPQFKNAPRLLYVGRHSPVPVFVVVGKGKDTEVFDEGITVTDQEKEEKEREVRRGQKVKRLHRRFHCRFPYLCS